LYKIRTVSEPESEEDMFAVPTDRLAGFYCVEEKFNNFSSLISALLKPGN
jgi:hypothetical protein